MAIIRTTLWEAFKSHVQDRMKKETKIPEFITSSPNSSLINTWKNKWKKQYLEYIESIYKNFTAHHLSKFVQNWSKMILLIVQLAHVAQHICLIFSALSTTWQTKKRKKKRKANNIIWPNILLKRANLKVETSITLQGQPISANQRERERVEWYE